MVGYSSCLLFQRTLFVLLVYAFRRVRISQVCLGKCFFNGFHVYEKWRILSSGKNALQVTIHHRFQQV